MRREISREVRAISRVFTLLQTPTLDSRVCSSITISSSEALPARSPMPLIAHSTWRQPASTPAKEFATAIPRSSWQCTEAVTFARSGTRRYSSRHSSVYSAGIV